MINKRNKIVKKEKEQHYQLESKVFTFDFLKLISNRRIPLLTLDERWLSLFPKEKMTIQMRELYVRVNELLKKQGKAMEEIKGYKRYKEQLMNEIVNNMEVNETILGKLRAKKLEKNQKLILNLNMQLQDSEDELAQIPEEIQATNEQLFAETTRTCFQHLVTTGDQLHQLKQTISEYEEKLLELKEEVKEVENSNREIYLYMHDMLGSDVMRKIDEEL